MKNDIYGGKHMITFAQYMPRYNAGFDDRENLVIVCKEKLSEIADNKEKFTEWLDIAAKFPELSIENHLALMVQRPDATNIMSFREWRSHNYQIKPYTQGIKLFRSQDFEDIKLSSVFDTNDVISLSEQAPETFRNSLKDNRYLYDIIYAGLSIISNNEAVTKYANELSLEDLYRRTFSYMYSATNDQFKAKCLTYMLLSSFGVDVSDHKEEIIKEMPEIKDMFAFMSTLDEVFSLTYTTIKANYAELHNHIESKKEFVNAAIDINTNDIQIKYVVFENGVCPKKSNKVEVNTIEEALNLYTQIPANKKTRAVGAIVSSPDDIVNGITFVILLGDRVIPQEEMRTQYIFPAIYHMPQIQESIQTIEEKYGHAQEKNFSIERKVESLYWFPNIASSEQKNRNLSR